MAEEGRSTSEEVGRVAGCAEGLAEECHGVEKAAVGARNAGADFIFGEGRTHHWRTHVVAGPIAREELVAGVKVFVEGCARVGNEPGRLEGGGGSRAEKFAAEANGAFGLFGCFPRITKHQRDMHIESSLGGGASPFADSLEGEVFVEAVERGLVRGFHPKEDEAEACAAHEAVVFKGEGAKTEVAVKAHLAVVAAGNHAVTEVAEPLANGKAAGVVHDFAYAEVDERANFVEHVLHRANAVGGIERRPRTEGALAVPTVARTHDVGTRRAGKVAIAVGVILPARQHAVDGRKRAEVNGNLALFQPREQREVVVTALEYDIYRRCVEGFFGECGHVIARHHEHTLRQARLEFARPLPMEMDDGCFGFKEDDIGLPRFKGRPEAFGCEVASNAIQPKHVVTARLEEGGRTCWNDRVDCRRVAKPLELTILRQQWCSLWRGNRRITEGNSTWFEI